METIADFATQVSTSTFHPTLLEQPFGNIPPLSIGSHCSKEVPMHTHRVIRHSALLLMLAAFMAVFLPLMVSAEDGSKGQPPLLPHEQTDFNPAVEQNKGTEREAPLLTAEGQGEPIPGHYIVVLHPGAAFSPDIAQQKVDNAGGKLNFTYTAALQGFAAELPDAGLNTLRADPDVAFIEQDQTVTIVDTQNNATWGLDRIDQRNRPLNSTYVYNQTGSGVHAYIIDTGIRSSHNEFSGRVGNGYDAIDGGAPDDCNGHGTHVAGTVGGTVYGVAKQVTLHGVRVLNCSGSGSNSGVIAGVDWVTQNRINPAVANMSLGGGVSSALDNAVANSISSGVTYAVAAGNSNANACNYSPARTASAITVGSTTSTDARSSFSNYGTCLDIFAPGSSITAAWYTSNTATNTISGTSMASPHVAGVAALYLQANPNASPTTVRNAIVNGGTTGVVTGAGSGSPNILLYSLIVGGGGPNPTPTPVPPNPTPPPGNTYTGSLSGAGDYDYQPNGNYFYANAGTHNGVLQGPGGTDFDLYLWRWNGSTWVTVAQGISATSYENVTYNGSAGYYVWRVYSYSGAGNYTLSITRP
jgi:subtilisin family serine protease